ncbi:MAG TPA: peroxiredoxin [Cyanobacteria bacterium UBA11149]|nr:peroxiredoxin [Cyanobacteria bacterium UBA11367]HBE58240.1 peroxiredoxin [Cyanobacteria bacterium UBA11366]HBK66959.1 peroxiredoxin [Cyanobacteria bacterium UBA11166]HBR75027.1 peroxiredoxin [Cyanobacteria bacterium UBA11159]HBS70766.1 peroxiredoxin [Cyanobacteria bacterium UBA11153]HBW88021.1 peroxiredoxin [Cyanobacteria bacterium UBA11149]HCA98079.1 peroxiredoxin [Cyanobacteria bacterium UBA9226]
MSEHIAVVQWQRNEAKFIDRQYSREHVWKFDGGAEILASPSPHVVPIPYSNPAGVDPEEAFIASLSSCHMLWFLAIAAKKKFLVNSYQDRAIGLLSKGENGQLAITRVNLHPQIIFAEDNLPTAKQIEEMHEEAHRSCFIANSVKTEIIIEGLRKC